MPRKQGEKTTRSVCYTINNYTPEQVELVIACNRDPVTGHVAYYEVGESGTPHIQGYIEFQNNKTFAAIHKFFGFHVDKILDRLGSAQEAWEYCRKGSLKHEEYVRYGKWEHPDFGKDARPVFEDYGQCSMQGRRNDIHQATQMVTEGVPMCEIAKTNPHAYVKFNRGLHALRGILMQPRRLQVSPEVVVYYGEAGSHKSHTVDEFKQELNGAMYTWNSDQEKWWDGYDAEECVHLEEFRGDMKFSSLLNLLDRYECRRPIKGGFVQIQASKFYITSPKHPRTWYANFADDKLAQLERRVTKIVKCSWTANPDAEWGKDFHQEEVPWDYAKEDDSLPRKRSYDEMERTCLIEK